MKRSLPSFTPRRLATAGAVATLTALLAACGGGSSSTSAPPPNGNPTIAERTAAATSTAQNNDDCNTLASFYWEIGDASGKLASGQVGSGAPSASTHMTIASASKWVYAAYVAERKNGVLSAQDDVPFLNFTSGYSNFDVPACPVQDGSVSECLFLGRGDINQTEADQHLFHYNSGHMQKHAELLGLGNLDNAGLAAEIGGEIGHGVALAYAEPQLAGGLVMNADNYAKFLRGLLSGASSPLALGSLLGSNKVCTLPSKCTSSVESPSSEDWHYSMGHWVEDDPTTSPAGDGSFSSPGAFGFYPWVNANRTLYGIVAREDKNVLVQQGFLSAMCGRQIRKAWVTATAQ